MSKITKPSTTTVVPEHDDKSEAESYQIAAAKQQFLSAALGMSWQLAIVVLVPIIGGYKLDVHTHSTPVYTITGFVIAIVGMVIVVWRQLLLLSPTTPRKGSHK